jgi:RNA-directed DNA polymerase
MSLEGKLERIIAEEAKKWMQRYHAYHNALELEYARKQKRVTTASTKELRVPDYWDRDNKFNPFHVYKRRRQIAKSIATKIRSNTYSPHPPEEKRIPKSPSGFRTVTVYQIPDSAVSLLIYQQLLKKNRHRFSSFSYAYRNDRNVHFAIQDIAFELKQNARVFIAEFDFSKFFDSINHEYLYSQFHENAFLISTQEEKIIRAFLGDSGKGIPQGTSISLFLANLVCWRLDKQLEKAGLQFARYADDTLIWSQDYHKISYAYDIINQFSREAGVPINADKSDGISLLCKKDMPAEITSTKENIDFLGYSVAVDSVSIKEKSVNKIKQQISYVLYKHLIQPLLGPRLVALQIPANDKDPALLSAMMEIRRYLYGNLSDEMIRNYLSGSSSRIFFKGIMSFYPLINNEAQLKELDGWLVSAIYKSLRERAHLLYRWGHNRYRIFPFNVSRKNVTKEFKEKIIRGKRLLQIPSFFTIYLALRKGLIEHGVEGVMNPKSGGYDY